MGEWSTIRIDRDSHPRSYPVKVGDLVECYVPFKVGPHYVRDLSLFVQHEGLKEIGVVYTSDPNTTGEGRISAFFFVQSAGFCTVRVTPVVVGEVAVEYAMSFLAPAEEP